MPFVIIARDKADAAALRASTRAEHLAYIEPFLPRILAAGAFLGDDGTTPAGSVILFDSEDRAEVERFLAGDPYHRAGLFAHVEVRRWCKVLFNGARAG